MLSDQEVRQTLISLDARFRAATNPAEEMFCSKLAIIELCGWLEEAMDEIVKRCSTRRLREVDNQTYCDYEVINRFEYEKHFRAMLIKLVGIIGIEWIESQVGTATRDRLKSLLGTLKTDRNSAAHTYIKGTTPRMNAPSIALNHLSLLKQDLSSFDKFISRKNW